MLNLLTRFSKMKHDLIQDCYRLLFEYLIEFMKQDPVKNNFRFHLGSNQEKPIDFDFDFFKFLSKWNSQLFC